MTANYVATGTSATTDLDDMFVTEYWLVDQYVGGQLYANGSNQATLGDGTALSKSSPVQIGSLTNWKQVACGYQVTAFIKTDNTLWVCGYSTAGQLGQGNTTTKNSPVQVGALTNWANVSVGNFTTASVKTDGTLWTWGLNSSGQLGLGNAVNRSSPTQVGVLTNWKSVSIFSQAHTAAIKTDGTLWTWGLNGNGQLGNSTILSQSSPVQIGSLTNWKQIATGDLHTAAVKTDGTLWTWGDNTFAQLGLGDLTSRSSPVQVGSLSDWKQVSCSFHGASSITGLTVALKNDGTMWAMGNNSGGELLTIVALGAIISSPMQLGTLTNWKQITCFSQSIAAVKTDGTLWGWGANQFGQISSPPNTGLSSPVQVGSLTNWKQVSGGYYYIGVVTNTTI